MTDMRKASTELYALVFAATLESDPLSGHLFVFLQSSARPDQDPFALTEVGLWVCANDWKQGTFAWAAGR